MSLIVSYSEARAYNDNKNRERGLRRLEKTVQKGKLTKKHINNRGYNKYLQLNGDVAVTIDYEKIKQDTKWDGLKGYITNTQMNPADVIDNYKQLWHIERLLESPKPICGYGQYITASPIGYRHTLSLHFVVINCIKNWKGIYRKRN